MTSESLTTVTAMTPPALVAANWVPRTHIAATDESGVA